MSAPDLVSLTSVDLLVSLRVPRGWEVEVIDADSFVVRGEPDVSGVGPALGVRGGRPEEPGHAWFDSFAAGVVDRLAHEVPEFELLGTERYRLSSRDADVFVVRARSLAEATGLPTAQLQAWVWAGSHQMLVLGGTTPVAHEARDLPVFADAVASLRLLAPRPPAG